MAARLLYTMRERSERLCIMLSSTFPGRHAGFSIAEITIILATLSVLGAVVSPSINDYVSDARRVKASSDVRVLASSLARLLYDVGGQVAPPSTGRRIEVLVGAGETPSIGNHGDTEWALPVDGTRVAALDDYLVTNEAGFPRGSRRWLVARGWSGPYVESGVGPDPWGNRYAVNVRTIAGTTGSSTIVLCAGPNGVVETSFDKGGLAVGGDDIIGLLGSGGR
jgi:type II secretory pathway pseudopilin PulG